MNDVLVAVLQLPHGVKGLVSPTPDGDYRVVLNSRLTAEERREVYNHELRHILENHFSRDEEPVHALEAAASSRGRLQSVIEKVEEQGLPGPPSLALLAAKQGGTGLAGQPPAPGPQKSGRHSTALLRARRAQITGHWY